MLYCPSCGAPISTSNSCFCGSPLQPQPVQPPYVTSNGPPNMAGWQAERLRLLEEEHRAAVEYLAAYDAIPREGCQSTVEEWTAAWDVAERTEVAWRAAHAAIPEVAP